MSAESASSTDSNSISLSARGGDSLASLKEGNRRFVHDEARHPNLDATLRSELAEQGQNPIATVLACSDSRVPVELVFDQGIGDLFVIRVAGNVVGTHGTGSVDFAVENLACPLIVVLGHRRCGAVTAAVKQQPSIPSVQRLLEQIEPAVREARRQAGDVDLETLVEIAVRENVWQSISNLVHCSDICRDRLRAGALAVIGAVYDIETGAVDWLGRHPGEAALLE